MLNYMIINTSYLTGRYVQERHYERHSVVVAVVSLVVFVILIITGG